MLTVETKMIDAAPTLVPTYETVAGMGKQYNLKRSLKVQKDIGVIVNEIENYCKRQSPIDLMRNVVLLRKPLDVEFVVALVLKSLSDEQRAELMPFFPELCDPDLYKKALYKCLLVLDSSGFFTNEAKITSFKWFKTLKLRKIVRWLEKEEIIVKGAIQIKFVTKTSLQFDYENILKLFSVLKQLRKLRPKLGNKQPIALTEYTQKCFLDPDYLANEVLGLTIDLNNEKSIQHLILKPVIGKHLYRRINRELKSMTPTYTERVLSYIDEINQPDGEVLNSEDPLVIGLLAIRECRQLQRTMVGFWQSPEGKEYFFAETEGKNYIQNRPFVLTSFELKMIQMIQSQNDYDPYLLELIGLPTLGVSKEENDYLTETGDNPKLSQLYSRATQLACFCAEYVDQYTFDGKFSSLTSQKRNCIEPKRKTSKDRGRGPTSVYNLLVTSLQIVLSEIDAVAKTIDNIDVSDVQVLKNLRKFLAVDIMSYLIGFDKDAFAPSFVPGWYYYLKSKGYTERYLCLRANEDLPVNLDEKRTPNLVTHEIEET